MKNIDFSSLPRDSKGQILPILVSGATGAIGREIFRALHEAEVPVVMACRSWKKAVDMLSGMNIPADSPGCEDAGFFSLFGDIYFLPVDLGSEESVRTAAALLPSDMKLGGLVNNAGVMNREFHIGPDGREDTLNVNYHNTKLFTELLLPHIAEGGAIVFTTSLTRYLRGHHNFPESISHEQFGQLSTYGLSKKLITVYAASLSERLKPAGIKVNCADPGIVDSGMIRMHRWFDPLADVFFRPFIRRPAAGAVPALRALAATSSGQIYCRRLTLPLPSWAYVK